MARISPSRHIVYRRLWVPDQRAEPFFPLSPRRQSWIISPGVAAGLPPARLAASAPNGIILNPSPHCELPSPANFSSSCLTVPSAEPNRPADLRRPCQLRSHKLRAGMVGRRAPSVLPQLYAAELLQRDATPVCRRSRCFQPAFAFSTILVTQHPKFSPSISAQSMGTKQPRQPFIDSLDRTFARYRRPDQLINVLNRLNVRPDDTHVSFQISRPVSRAGKPNKQ